MTSMADTNLAYRDGEHPIHGTWLSVDVVALTLDPDEARVVLIRRKASPHRGATTLPGGLLAAWDGETVDTAARRIVAEKAGLQVSDIGTVALDVVSDPGRDERGHTVSVVVAARVTGGVRAGVPGAVFAEDVPADMPFGHSMMLRRALEIIKTRMLVDPGLTRALLGSVTSAAQVASVLRACGGVGDPVRSARTRLQHSALYRRAESVHTGGPGRPTQLYRWADERTDR